MKLRGAFALLLAFAFACADARARDDAPTLGAHADAVKASPEFPAPTDANVAALWEDFLARGTMGAVVAVGDVADVTDDDGEFDAARCRDNEKLLRHATAVAPVSVGAWYFAHRCAQAMGDEAWAAAALESFAALSRHALLSTGANEWDPPIRIVAALDVDAFIMASGQALLYRYIDPVSLPRALTYRVALRDSVDGPVRSFRLDYLDTIMRLTHEHGHDVPFVRKQVVKSWLDEPQEGSDADEAQAVMKAMAERDEAARYARLRALAREANLFAAFSYADHCLRRDSDCAAEAVDVLLPLAETRVPEAMARLAYANAVGRGTRRDEKAARVLLDAVVARVGTAEAHALFAIAWWQGSVGEKLPRWALEPLRDAARAGNDRAIAVYATATALKKGKPHRDAVAMLEAAVRERRSPPAAFLLALHAIDLHADPARTIELLRIAAETGYEGAYTLLAATLERDAPQLAEEARRWRLESARAGSSESARKVADWYAEGTPARDARLAQLWYVEAVRHEDMVAALSLAKLLLSEPKGVVGGLPDAAKLLQGLTEMGDAEARRLYANLLVLGRGVDRDAAEAERLLRKGIAAGDHKSQVALGVWLAGGDMGSDRVAEGVPELEKAAARGFGPALNALAQFRYWGVGVSADHAGARKSWEQALETGYLPAFNEFAWHLCTVPDESFVDARRGLEVMATMSERVDLLWSAIDTEAACRAAAGEYDAAVATQQRAIESARGAGASARTLESMQARLELYRRRERTIIQHPPFAAETPTAPAD